MKRMAMVMVAATMAMVGACSKGAANEATVAYYEAPAITVSASRGQVAYYEAPTITVSASRGQVAYYDAPAITVIASRVARLRYDAPAITIAAKRPSADASQVTLALAVSGSRL